MGEETASVRVLVDQPFDKRSVGTQISLLAKNSPADRFFKFLLLQTPDITF